MNVFNDGCDEAFQQRLKDVHEAFCKVVLDNVDDAEKQANIISAFVDACSTLVPDAELNIVSRHTNCYRVVCSHCGTSWAVGANIPFEDWCASKPFCVKCGAKLKKGIEMCDAMLTD